jgi:YggT family protein
LAILFVFIGYLANILAIAILIRALLSWIPNLDRRNSLVQILEQITDPVLMPLRRVIPTIGMIDITPLVAMLLLSVISQMAFSLAPASF